MSSQADVFVILPPPPVAPSVTLSVAPSEVPSVTPPAVDDTLWQKGMQAHRIGQDMEAVPLLHQACRQYPDHAAWHCDLAQALLGIRQAEAALREADQALALAPALEARVQRIRALALVRLRRIPEADAAADAGLRREPGSPAGLTVQATVRMMQGRLAEADALFTQALRLDPDQAEALANYAQVLLRLNRLAEALTATRRAIALKPLLGGSHYLLGQLYNRAGQLAEAEAAWREAVRLDPTLVVALSDLGDLLRQRERPVEAEDMCRRGLAQEPRHIGLLVNLATAMQAQGRNEAALTVYNQVLAIDAKVAEVHNNLGRMHEEAGRLEEALAAFRQAVALKPKHEEFRRALERALMRTGQLDPEIARQVARQHPNDPDAQVNLGAVLLDKGDVAEAEHALRQALRLKPDHPGAHAALAKVLFVQQRYEAADTALREALALRPDIADLHSQRAGLLLTLNREAEAEAAARRGLVFDPHHSGALLNLATALVRRGGAWDEAEHVARAAVTQNPKSAEAQIMLGNALQARGNIRAAETAFREAIRLAPELAIAYTNLGNIFKEYGAIPESLALQRTALTLRPDYAEGLSNLALTLHAAPGGLEEAHDLLRWATVVKPGMIEAYCNLGLTLQYLGRLEEAEAAYRQGLGLKPDDANTACNLGSCLNAQGRRQEAEDTYRALLTRHPDNRTAYNNLLFSMNYDPSVSRAAVYQAHCDWGKRVEGDGVGTPGWVTPLPPASPNRDPQRRLRIGYVSADFGRHPVGYFLAPLLAAQDHSLVETVCYSGRYMPDTVTEFLKARSTLWRSTLGISDTDLARQIRTDNIDILVDLAGHTSGNRLPVFAARPAPVQVSWLGYPNTTGLTAIDYRLTDAICDPEGDADPFHSEILLRLAKGFLCFMAPGDWPVPASLPADRRHDITFGCFNNLVKLTSDTIAVWARILARVPESRLLLKSHQLADPSVRGRIRGLFEANDIDARRVELLGWLQNPQEHITAVTHLDIALDTFPYNGTGTTCEALWMGVPVVTLRGDRHAARVGASLLTTIGLPELIAEDADGYVDTAVALAGDRPRLLGLRATLRDRFRASPLGDGVAFARKMEQTYRWMWHRWCGVAG